MQLLTKRQVTGIIIAVPLFIAGGIFFYYSVDNYNQTLLSRSADCLGKGGCIPIDYIPAAITWAILGALSLAFGVLTLMIARWFAMRRTSSDAASHK
jgi:hypothetical protein